MKKKIITFLMLCCLFCLTGCSNEVKQEENAEVEKNDELAYKYFKTAIDTVGTSVIHEKDYPGVYELIRDYEEKHG